MGRTCHNEYTLTGSMLQIVREGFGMIACYCRVSSRSQKTDSQKAELTRWLSHQGHALTAVQWFEDIERGQTLRRPAFARLQRAIGAGTIALGVRQVCHFAGATDQLVALRGTTRPVDTVGRFPPSFAGRYSNPGANTC